MSRRGACIGPNDWTAQLDLPCWCWNKTKYEVIMNGLGYEKHIVYISVWYISAGKPAAELSRSFSISLSLFWFFIPWCCQAAGIRFYRKLNALFNGVFGFLLSFAVDEKKKAKVLRYITTETSDGKLSAEFWAELGKPSQNLDPLALLRFFRP